MCVVVTEVVICQITFLFHVQRIYILFEQNCSQKYYHQLYNVELQYIPSLLYSLFARDCCYLTCNTDRKSGVLVIIRIFGIQTGKVDGNINVQTNSFNYRIYYENKMEPQVNAVKN